MTKPFARQIIDKHWLDGSEPTTLEQLVAAVKLHEAAELTRRGPLAQLHYLSTVSSTDAGRDILNRLGAKEFLV